MEPENASRTYPAFSTFSVADEQMTGCNTFIHTFRSKDGTVSTQEFHERPHHGGEISIYKPVDWKEKIPADAELQGCNSGTFNDAIHNYWVTWTEPGQLKALSIVIEDPVSVSIEPGDSLIDGPLQGTDGKLHVYFWRKTASGRELFVHTFTGEPKKKGQVATERLLAIKDEPLFTRAEPIPMRFIHKKGFERAGLAVIAWLTKDAGGMRAHGVWQDGPDWKAFDSDPISGYAPFPNQRLGLWADPDTNALKLAWVMGRSDSDTLRMGEWWAEARTGHQSVRIDARAHGGSKVFAAACVQERSSYYPDIVPEARCYYLTRTGNLYQQSRSEMRKIRDNVPLDYDFPIFASQQNFWEARRDPKGEIYLDNPESGLR